MGKYTCKKCGSINIEQKVWVDVNTEHVLDACSDGEIEDQWCRDCNDNCEIKYVDEQSGEI